MNVGNTIMRQESDFLGSRALPTDALYGLQTLRARENFALDETETPRELIQAMLLIKKAASISYQRLGVGKPGVYAAIEAACDRALAGEADAALGIQALQGGAGTAAHMNVNEVLANLALRELGFPCGAYAHVHPLDDVNRGQSTNDVYPTALRIAAIWQLRLLSEECAKLQEALQEKENAFEAIPKLGRTEWMDAVPITLGSAFGAFAQAIARDRWRLYKIEERLRQVNLGGAAVGRGGNASRQYRHRVLEELRVLSGIGLAAAEYPMDPTQNQDVFTEVSGLLKAAAVNWIKLCGDLRRMGSGPHGGLGELRLAPLQQGSTIMPGKVNPVIAEMATQVAMQVIANDTAITLAASQGEFELNAFLPLIAKALLESLRLMTKAAALLREKCIVPLKANPARCRALLESSCAFATDYCPALGYQTVSALCALHDGNPPALRQALDAALAEKSLESAAADSSLAADAAAPASPDGNSPRD
ncbi:MAG: aspartate ammonia-lyase [Oscillospiraceae bacterium]|jgi:aspartate ammonia-lyase|nr:aspartate ammonia-lyase [Oscillospiraceae bacterium]